MKRSIFSIFALCAFSASLLALPARRDAILLTQPDGTQLTAFQHGDEYYHYFTNAEGLMLISDEEGFYRAVEMPSDEEIAARRNRNPRRVAQQQKIGGELNLAPRGLIILVNFSDLEFATDIAEIDSMINGLDFSRDYTYKYWGHTYSVTSWGSARQYFSETSQGQYNPVFDVVGPVTVSHAYSYYGSNDSQGNDKHPEQMIKEACELLEDIVDFSLYDNNDDDKVDFVYVIYAGYGEADGGAANTIWPHNYSLAYTGTSCWVDGKKVENYACSNELSTFSKTYEGIGAFCHEFSHVLGLPDLYPTNNSTHKTLGSWDILDYGPYNNDGNTPPNYSAYERFYMGWLTPDLICDTCDVQISPLHTSNSAIIMTSTGEHNLNGFSPNPTTFYMVENRQMEGWDKYLPGHGMLVTKIKFSRSKWDGNTVNNTKTSMGVDLIEADGSAPSGSSGKAGDAFPKGATSFTNVEEFQITDIEEIDGEIYFKVNGGTPVHDAVDDVRQSTPASRKVMRDGQILIERNCVYFDLLGNRK